MIVAGIELTDEQFFTLRDFFYGEYDKELIRKMLDVLQVHAGIKGDEAIDAYISTRKEELVETYAPNMRRYFDESLDVCSGCDLSGSLDSLWDELPWSRIEKEFEEDTE